MSVALRVFTALAFAELLVWLPPLWRYRKITAGAFAVGVGLSAVWLLVSSPTFLVSLLVSVAAYRFINLLRVVSGRMREQYLRDVSWRSAWWLGATSLFVLFAWWLIHVLTVPQAIVWYAVLLAQLVMALVLLVTTLRHLRTTRPPQLAAATPHSQLPALTVAIPARNETDQLEKCLRSLVVSDYPKLEILVLDDCSQERRTPEIIRAYAHDGVRFLAGEPEQEGWLAKNQAYEKLAQNASGEYILFCGVDATFEPQSLRLLVETMLAKNKSMISVIPKNNHPAKDALLALLVQPMRYAWEIALPRKFFRRPPVLSTCWIIQRNLLETAGSFKAVTRSIVPESYFARVATVHDGYSLMQSSPEMGIACDKDVSEQHDTATRMKYPQVHRRPELVLFLTLGELLALILPPAFWIASFAAPELRLLAALSGLTSLLLTIWYVIIVSLVYRRFVFWSIIALPFAVIHDVAVLNYSMLKYEFSVVLWKGRNVCIPVMRVEPKLPAIESKPSNA